MTDDRLSAAMAWLRADVRRFDLAVAAATLALGSLLLFVEPNDFETGRPEWVAGLVAFVVVLFRRWQPFVMLAVALAWTAGHVALFDRPTPTVFAVIVLVATVAVRLERTRAIVFGLSVGLSIYVLGLIGNDAELGDARALIGIVWTAFAVGVADAVRSWRRYRDATAAEMRSAVLASEARVRQHVSEERLEIARELHDLLAHNLSVMNVQTGAALHLLRNDPDRAEASLQVAREAGRTVLDELRELLAVLRHEGDGADAPTSSLPTFDDLPGLVDTLRATGLDVRWRTEGEARALAPAVSLAAYRIAQEALTNAAKHGIGGADLLTTWSDAGLGVRVENPVGATATADVAGSGLGLIGMRERAVANGGHLDVEATGTRHVIDARLPVSAGVGPTR